MTDRFDELANSYLLDRFEEARRIDIDPLAALLRRVRDEEREKCAEMADELRGFWLSLSNTPDNEPKKSIAECAFRISEQAQIWAIGIREQSP